MRKCTILLVFLLFVGCEKVDRVMEADLSVVESLALKGEASGALETITPGIHPVVLEFRAGESSKGPGRILLSVGGKSYSFSVSTEKLSELVGGDDFTTRLASADLGQAYDIQLTHRREVTDGPLQEGIEVFCWDPLSPESRFPTYIQQYFYEQTIDEYYHVAFLQPGASDGAGLASIEVSQQRVEMVEDLLPIHCL